ncbi:DUF362 domain-containing protein [Elusimicrobiota bacterium]
MKEKVSIVKSQSYNFPSLYTSVRKSVDLIGGIKKYIKPNEKILLKPNLLSAKEPERGVTTHPEVIRALIRMTREAGAIPILGDSPGGAVKGLERVWDKTGMKKLAEQEKVDLVSFEAAGSKQVKINHPLIKSIHLSNTVFDVDGIINIPKLKTHGLMLMTGTIKNLYGCVPGLRKAEYHKYAPYPKDFGLLLKEIYLQLKDKIRFSLIDGIVSMEGNGPSSGELRNTNILISGNNALVTDKIVARIFGFDERKIETINCFEKNEQSDITNIEIVGENLNTLNFGKFKLPSNWYIHLVPKFLVDLLGKLLWLKPKIDQTKCIDCMMCFDSCPVKAIKKDKNNKLIVDKKECISCLCCHELCPYNSIELESSFVSKILIRH